MSAADLDVVRRLAAADHGLVVLATTRPDGSVHASVVNAGVLDDPVTGQPVVGMVIRGDARKLDHLRRTGSATVVFRAGWEWVSVEGTVGIAGPNDPLAGFDAARLPRLLRDIFTSAGGTHDDWATYDRVMAREHRTAVLLSPGRITSN
ncbi:MAG TPA: pyridoxamine 5'-phosphate oxidase family protein [Pseudonocardiaceae bacterium]|nr:pyridoxamine 5'-phosphate oxidase family protein [Pseudonocardiaceae bacterium]